MSILSDAERGGYGRRIGGMKLRQLYRVVSKLSRSANAFNNDLGCHEPSKASTVTAYFDTIAQ
jgi:hypothetical protein